MTAPATISWLAYGWESTYGTESTVIDKQFGQGVKVSNLTRKNNIEEVYTMGYRVAQKLPPKRYEGSFTVEFVLANPWFFKTVLGTETPSGTTSPYTHTYTEGDTAPAITIVDNLQLTAARQATLIGVKVATGNISAAINELARVRLDCIYGKEGFDTSTASKVAEAFDLFTFAHGTLEAPNGSTLAQIQNVDMNIAGNPEVIYGLGSRIAQECAVKNYKHSGSVTMALQASVDLLEKFYGQATGGPTTPDLTEVATMELTFTNGLTGTNTRSIALLWTGVQLDEESMPQDPTQVIMEDVATMMRTLTVTSINATQTAL